MIKARDFILVITTCPDQACADALAEALVQQKLAACVQQIPGIRSFYQWKGNIEVDNEVLLHIKARASRFEEVAASINALHPYELPEIIAIPLEAASGPYLRWLDESVTA
ncbi:MAG: divalent-cation tolerance protein CutA [Gammaproteobacteria bacterium]|nr:MAG: divalent-cation tolerance protein CutA [Gammaproteobacteria bacterium]RTZ60032.1 MAG: divalent-cation tolerance protein CutA [Gammaproteobacteria bacterium]